jgi:radical SAM protein with 4Fe4S-binding SPASM domain
MAGYVERVLSASFPVFRGKAPALGHLDIELTERCNNNCVHCCINLPEGDESARVREMSEAQVGRILEAAAGLGALSVRFTGGEPLLRADFPAMYLRARKLGLRVLVFTNARLITSELAALFARVPPLRPIEVTVYGMTPASYEAVSLVPDSHAEFLRGVELLRAHGVRFVVKGAALPPNLGELDAFRAWAASIPAMERPPALSAFFDLRHRRDSEAKNRRILALRPQPTQGLALLRRVGGTDLREMREFCSRFMGAQGARLFACGAGFGVSVDAYGRAQPCLGLRAPELTYDLLHGSLVEALRDFFPKIRAIEATNPAYLERCARCFLKGLCEQCPAKSWAEHGTLDTPVEYLCDIAHEEARELGLLQPGEKAWQVVDAAARVARLAGGKP